MNNRKLSFFFLIGMAFCGLALTGCGSADVKLAPVSGTVKMNGDPLPGATVIFKPRLSQLEHPEKPSAECFGKTDQNGHYELEVVLTGEKGGAVGMNDVIITLDAFEEILPSYDAAGRDRRGPNPIPPKYNKSTTLKFEVPPEGTQNADFPLENPDFKVPETKANPQQDG